MKKKELTENEEVIKDMSKLLLFWIGIIICILSIVGFFVSSEWISNSYQKSFSDYSGNDSNASSFLLNLELYFLKVAGWLKELPIWTKIIGVIWGGIIAASNHED